MNTIEKRVQGAEWEAARENLLNTGYALLPGILNEGECRALIGQYEDEALYRKTISMERYRFGAGEYKYFRDPLPQLITQLRESVYPELVPVANAWMKALHMDTHYPAKFSQWQQHCRKHGQTQPTVLILQYGKGGHNTLHQDLYGPVFFPMQVVFFLTEPGIDYTGGEFVLIEHRPRAQSKAIVLQPKQGDMLAFTTNFRPVQGSKGYYRVNMKHGVAEVQQGNRYTLGIIFHDAV